jgi:DNA polymerase III alpha subunit
MNYALSNGLDAHAFTDHGTMAGFSYAYLHNKKMNSEGKNFKLIHGVEALLIQISKEWNEFYVQNKDVRKKSDDSDEAGLVVENEEDKKQEPQEIFSMRDLILFFCSK